MRFDLANKVDTLTPGRNRISILSIITSINIGIRLLTWDLSFVEVQEIEKDLLASIVSIVSTLDATNRILEKSPRKSNANGLFIKRGGMCMWPLHITEYSSQYRF